MALVRRNTSVYYYTYKRVSDRVRRIYGGSGIVAELAAKLNDCSREIARVNRDLAADRVTRKQETTQRIRQWLKSVDQQLAETMLMHGWHQHKREWRLRRGAQVNRSERAEAARATWEPARISAMVKAENPDLAAKASNNEPMSREEVDQFLTDPAAVMMWGDIGRRILRRWVRKTVGEHLVSEGAVLKLASDLRSSLAGANPNTLVWMLAERVVIAWVFLSWSEMQYASTCDSLKPAEAKIQFARMGLAHRNLMTAARTLAKVRRVSLPKIMEIVEVRPAIAEAN